jgi:pSer/pThr/pTyr-binding forkhead associated (FHA) protein
VLHDLRSTNGTFVNDKRVSRHTLADGDSVQIGETVMQFRNEYRRA